MSEYVYSIHPFGNGKPVNKVEVVSRTARTISYRYPADVHPQMIRREFTRDNVVFDTFEEARSTLLVQALGQEASAREDLARAIVFSMSVEKATEDMS
jgi:hypothetical protein